MEDSKLQLGKLLRKENLFVLVLVGVLLFVITIPVGKGEKHTDDSKETVAEKGTVQMSEEDAYRMKMEQEVADFLQSMETLGRVKVLLTLKSGSEEVLQTGHVVTRNMPKVQGVLVLAEGAEYGKNRALVTDMMTALFDLSADKVQVAKMKSK